MKRLMTAALAALLVLLFATVACASNVTHTGTGESVSSSGGSLAVYDREVIVNVPVDVNFRGVTIQDAQPPKAVLKTVGTSLAQALASGEVTDVHVPTLPGVPAEKAAQVAQLPVTEQVDALLLMLGLVDAADVSSDVTALELPVMDIFDPATGEFTVDPNAFGADGVEFGYLPGPDGGVIPFIGVSFQMTYADAGEYAGLPEDQRAYVETYTFTWETHNDDAEPSWGLSGIVSGVESYVTGAN